MKLDLPSEFESQANSRSQDIQSGVWSLRPLPLPKLPAVPELPLEILPDGLIKWVADCADRARYKPDFVAVPAMVSLSSFIGRRVGIRLKGQDDWTEHANLWGALIGQPSALKSPAMRTGLAPFKALQIRADEAHQIEVVDVLARQEAWKLRREAQKKNTLKKLAKDPDAQIDPMSDPMPEIEPGRTLWTSNVNSASLGVLLEQNPDGLLIERDELSALLTGLEHEQNSDLRGLLLSGWSGSESYRFDRIGRGITTLPKFAVSVIGGIQPGPLARYVRSAFTGERADGLLQRFQLLVWPEAESFKYVDRLPDGLAKEQAAALFDRADSFDFHRTGVADSSGDSPTITLSAEAQEIFKDWFTQFMQSQRSEQNTHSGPLQAHFGKYPGLVGKLSLIIHVADEIQASEVSARTIMKALAWLDYLTPHARRVYHSTEHPETTAAELLLGRLKRGELPTSFKSWEISRKGWHGLGDRESVKRACRLLFEFNWLIELDPGGFTGGRPSDPVYAVSPGALT